MDENKNQNGAFDDFSIEDILNSINQKADQKVSEHLNDIKTPEEASASTTDVSTAAADGKADDKPAGNSEKRKKEAAAPDKSDEGVDMATVSLRLLEKGKHRHRTIFSASLKAREFQTLQNRLRTPKK